jgi:transposase, IS30 family
MTRGYCHLSIADRRTIADLLSARTPVQVIAKVLGRHVSTIYRELKRNFFFDDDRFYRGYFPLAADNQARERRARTGKLHRNHDLAVYVADRLEHAWSPEQIAGYLKHHGHDGFYACHETIYRYVYSRDGQQQDLYRLLPVARRTRRPRRSRRLRGPQIPLANTIAMRPPEISERLDSGHWEADLVQFKKEHGKANLTSLVERKSRYIYLMRNPDRGSSGVIGGIERKLEALPPELRQTITFDRGTEFASYPRLKEKLGVDSYFCKPQAPWQKGTVENSNGRLRRFLPRETDIARLGSREIEAVAHRLNHTPRKCLGYRTPHEVLTCQLMSHHPAATPNQNLSHLK